MVSLLLELLDDETSGKLQDKQPYQKQVKTSINYKQKKKTTQKTKILTFKLLSVIPFFIPSPLSSSSFTVSSQHASL